MANYHYSAFGLNIRSDFQLKGFTKNSKIPDTFLKIGKVPNYLESKNKNKKISVEIMPGKILQKSDLYNYLILEGKEIIVPEGFLDLDPETKRMFYEIFAMYIWLQRGALIMHGSAVNLDGKAYLFIGDGGSGKSTTSLYFSEKGYEKLSDDMAIVYKNENNNFSVIPSCIRENLTINTLNLFNISKDNLKQMPGEEKFISDVKPSGSKSFPLGGIVYLEKDEDIKNIKHNKIQGKNKLKKINENLLKQKESQIAEKKKGDYLKTILKMLNFFDMIEIKRPHQKNSLEKIEKIIMDWI